ncbi:hypothetical protein RIF29_26958 [Crotalaria pallida]|uniref:H(+)-transporting two-sector ATPase n=1 Tax=Crotalaria pallida TaxID=3830 RepID=A0AAN9ENA2_CROPI
MLAGNFFHPLKFGWLHLTMLQRLMVVSLCLLVLENERVRVFALLGHIPSAVGYQPTLSTDLGGLQESITATKKGSITSVQSIYVQADDLTNPAPATTFAHLDATTVLSQQISKLGIYLAVDPLDSSSRMLSPHILSEDHYETARSVQNNVLQN